MKQLTYRAVVDGGELVIRFRRGEFHTEDPAASMADDPPRSAGAAGAHAWHAVVLAWSRRGDHRLRWSRDVVRDIVADARGRWTAGAEAQQRRTVHELQEAARRAAEERYPPARRRSDADLPPALRGAVLRQPPRRRS